MSIFGKFTDSKSAVVVINDVLVGTKELLHLIIILGCKEERI